MTQDQFARALDRTFALMKRGDDITPRRTPEVPTCLEHLAWMLVEAGSFYADDKREKANRWLGYVQGVMTAFGTATVEELKRANMPEGAIYDGEKL